MRDFIINYYAVVVKGIEIIAAIIGLFCYKKFKKSVVKYFIYFLFYVVAVETLGSYTIYIEKYAFLKEIKHAIKNTYFELNCWWFTLFWEIGSVLFLAFYFNKILKTLIYKTIIKYVTSIFLIGSLLWILLNWKAFFNTFSSIITVLASIVIILITILYFIEVLSSERIVSFYKSMHFYIIAPFFIWTILLTPLEFYSMYFFASDWNFIILKCEIYLITNLFLYTTFSIGLLISKPEYD